MKEDISKDIMNRTRLRNKFLKSRSFEDKAAFNKQKNYCMSLVRKTKADYYSNLNHKKVVDNKSFWKYITPHFSDKSSSFDKITLVEKDLIIDQNEAIAKTFNDFFTKVVSNLNIIQYEDPSLNFE